MPDQTAGVSGSPADAAADGGTPAEPFVHLRLRTEYSISDGMLRLTPGPGSGADNGGRRKDRKDPRLAGARASAKRTLAPAAAQRGIEAMAIADDNNLFGAVKFHKTCVGNRIKPIIGCDMGIERPPEGSPAHRGASMLFLCKDAEGYLNLCRLLTDAYRNSADGKSAPWVDPRAAGEEGLKGMIALSGWVSGKIGELLASGDRKGARREAERWRSLLGDRFYLEIQRVGATGEEDLVAAHLDLGDEIGVPVACTHPVQFLDPEDFSAHEVRACIYEGTYLDDQERGRRFSEEQYLKSAAEMRGLFADVPSAVENAVQIARRCNFRFEFGEVLLPSLPKAEEDSRGLLGRAREDLDAILDKDRPPDREPYYARLETEASMIGEMGFTDYFLIVAGIVRWAKENGIPVGPGRGSGAGSLVAYALGITGLDPIRHGLLFERFLNPERVSMPDFDIDFCQDKRERLIRHVRERYGEECVSQICTFGTLGAKAAVRSVGRPLGMSYGRCDQIARLIPFAIDMTLERAQDESEELREAIRGDSEVARLFEIAHQLEGLPRNVSTHAGGVLIAPGQMVDHCPMYATPDSGGFASQFDKDDVEAIGLVKFDFLGLTTLTTIAEALEHAARLDPRYGGWGPEDIPLDDPEVYGLFAKADTMGVFQCESQGMRELMLRLVPDRFEDVVALIALFRPGPLESGMADDYITRKRDRSEIDLIHPSLEGVLGDTYGVVVYQEQVMQIAQVLADYSLGEADLLRRAMGKKKPEEMAAHKERFVAAAGPRMSGGKRAAAELFERIEKFAGYGFNKSHAAAYALLAAQTAWLKLRVPAAFFAAAMSAEMNKSESIRRLMRNAKKDHNINVEPPDVNASGPRFVPSDAFTVRFGLCGIKGVGRAAAEALVEERERRGPFAGIEDYLARTRGIPLLGRKAHEMLARAGALDSLNPNRAQTLETVGIRLSDGPAQGSENQVSLFDDEGVDSFLPDVPEWDAEQKFAAEMEATGLTLTGHYFEAYAAWVRDHCKPRSIAELTPGEEPRRIAAVVTGNPTSGALAQKGMAALELEDSSGEIEAIMDAGLLRSQPELAKIGSLIIAEGNYRENRRRASGFRITRAWTREKWISDRLRALRITLDPEDDDLDARIHHLNGVLKTYSGEGPCDVFLRCAGPEFRCDIDLGNAWRIAPQIETVRMLEEAFGQASVTQVYA